MSKPPLLVLVGALGDLAVRRFLAAAQRLARERKDLTVLLVDQPWSNGVCLQDELRLRLGRRLIEHRAEGADLNPPSQDTRYPWTVESFVDGYVQAAARVRVQDELNSRLNELMEWFLEPVQVPGLPTPITRYQPDLATSAGDDLRSQLRKQPFVVVYVATGPLAHQLVLAQWCCHADRIVFDKPLLPCTADGSRGADGIMQEIASAQQARCEVSTLDHFNARATALLAERLSTLGLIDGLIAPTRLQRIVVEIMEEGPLPAGRCSFYNSVRGALGDMGSHMLYVVRAVLAPFVGQSIVKCLSMDTQDWSVTNGIAEDAPTKTHSMWGPEGAAAEPKEKPGHVRDAAYYVPLADGIPTFASLHTHLKFPAGWSVPLFARTGKHSHHPTRSLRLDVRTTNGSSASVTLPLERALGTVKLSAGDYQIEAKVGAGSDASRTEYFAIFEEIVDPTRRLDSDRRPGAVYFPPPDEAAELSRLMCTLSHRTSSSMPVYGRNRGFQALRPTLKCSQCDPNTGMRELWT